MVSLSATHVHILPSNCHIGGSPRLDYSPSSVVHSTTGSLRSPVAHSEGGSTSTSSLAASPSSLASGVSSFPTRPPQLGSSHPQNVLSLSSVSAKAKLVSDAKRSRSRNSVNHSSTSSCGLCLSSWHLHTPSMVLYPDLVPSSSAHSAGPLSNPFSGNSLSVHSASSSSYSAVTFQARSPTSASYSSSSCAFPSSPAAQ